jgi:O-antigen/teichoic acid export membrane protein
MTPPKRTMKQKVLRAGSWVLLGHVLSQALRLATNIVISRLLAPDAFGLMSVVVVLMVALALFSDLGINRSVIQSPRGHEPEFLDTAWSVQVLRGAALAGVSLLLALGLGLAAWWQLPTPGTVYADPRLPWLVASFSVVALMQGFESVRIETARRTMQQQRMTRLELASQAGAAVGMLAVAVVTHSIWSLVVGAVLAGALRCWMSHRWLPGHSERWRLEPAAVRELMGQAKWILPASILGFIAINGDRVLLGGLIDSHTFGLYAIAFLLINALQNVAYTLCTNVVYPALSEILRERPQQLGDTMTRFQWAYDALVTTLAACAVTGGPAVVGLLYDARYQEAGWMLSLLAAGAIGLRSMVVEQCYLAIGQPALITLTSGLRLVALATGIVLGHHWFGLQGAIAGIALSPYAAWPLSLWFKAKHGAFRWRAEALLLPALGLGLGLGWVFSQIAAKYSA